MLTIDIVEIFGKDGDYIIQGEGQRVGYPAIFIRTFGCNLKCKFDLKTANDVKVWEDTVRSWPEKYETLEELPSLAMGCDTPYSIFPEFNKYIKTYTVEELLAALNLRCENWKNVDLVITGGEPLLAKNQPFWDEFLLYAWSIAGIKNVTFETNTTQLITDMPRVTSQVNKRNSTLNIFFSMSPKLASSGHFHVTTIKPAVVSQYCNFGYNSSAWFKFVVNCENDIQNIREYIALCGDDEICRAVDIPIYLMPSGGAFNRYMKNAETVYNLCAKYGYRFSPRLQVMHAGNAIGK